MLVYCNDICICSNNISQIMLAIVAILTAGLGEQTNLGPVKRWFDS